MAKALKVMTVRFIEALKPVGRQIDHRDGQVRGLMLRVSEHGTKAFCVQYKRRSDGKTRRVTSEMRLFSAGWTEATGPPSRPPAC